MFSHFHLGTGFEIWTSQQSWFWRLSDPHRNGGSIGAAATEAAAVREACFAIEENSCRSPGACRIDPDSTLAGWELSLAKLERYLTTIDQAQA